MRFAPIDAPVPDDLGRGASVEHLLVPLRAGLDEEGVTELAVNRPGEFWLECDGRWERREAPGLTFDRLLRLAVAVARYHDGEISDARPLLSAVLPGGERIQLVIPPACEPGTVSITIRKPARGVIPLDDYAAGGFFDRLRANRTAPGGLTEGDRQLLALKEQGRYVEFLRLSVRLGKVIVNAGETGSGKTTFAKAMLLEMPRHLRIVSIEDVPELVFPNHPNHVRLFYPSEAKEEENAPVTAASLLRSCLRMKPDRIMLAELRGGETFDFVNGAASGHAGSMTTVHAGSPDLVFERMALMMLQNRQGRAMPYEVIQRLLRQVVDVIVQIHDDDGRHASGLWFDPESKLKP